MTTRTARGTLVALLLATLGSLSCEQTKPAQAPRQPSAPAPVAASPSAPAPAANAVQVELFVMSQCPYGVQAVNAIKPAIEKLGPDVAFRLDYIGDIDGNGTPSSMHGPDEVIGDIAQLCAARYAPTRFLDMVACQNEHVRDVANSWMLCARTAGLPVESIAKCVAGPEGGQLLAASFARSAAKGATGSPTIYIAGKPYEGRRGTNDFLRSVCAEYKGPTAPAACKDVPEAPTVNVILVSDKRCSDCETDQVADAVRARIVRPKLDVVDYADARGKALWEETGRGPLPFLLFDDTLDADDEAHEMVADGLHPAGRFRKLDLDGNFRPECADDGGCKLPGCAQTFACRKEQPNTLELFVMSHCPYGIRALNSMKEVLDNFHGRVDFRVHYIARGTAKDGFQSMHGPSEVEENIRELCAIKSYARNQRFMDYILCRNKSIGDAAWESCAAGAISAATIRSCVQREGARLHENDIGIAQALGIGASPTWVVNGKYKFEGLDAETVRRNFCEHNPKTPGCENKLSGPDAQGPATGGGCGN